MDYFHEHFPPEIVAIILSKLDYGTKVLMRATNSYYRQQIPMPYFNIYFTRASKLPEIIDYMVENYGNMPLGIHFKKSIDNDLNPYAEHIWKLSNLTALSFDFLPSYMSHRTPSNHFSNLQRLKNLEEFPDYPARSQGSYLNLRAIRLDTYNDNDLAQMTNIREITHSEDYINIYLLRDKDPLSILPNPDLVTSITLRKKYIDLGVLTRFNNLNYLYFIDASNHENNNLLGKLSTSIQTLVLGSMYHYDYYNMTNLTYLNMDVVTEDINQITALHKLKKLTVGFGSIASAYNAQGLDLAPLTALETVQWRNVTLSTVFATIQSTHLTHLEVSVDDGLDLGTLAPFDRSLKELTLREATQTNDIDYSPLSSLTNLEKLWIRVNSDRHSLATSIQNLTNLRALEIRNTSKNNAPLIAREGLSLSKFTTLESLCLSSSSAEFLNDISSFASKLTRLDCALTAEQLDKNDTCLTSLTNLEALFLNEPLNDYRFWQYLQYMTKLHSLSFWKLDVEEKILALSALPNLTMLSVYRSKSLRGIYLTCLTSLQFLSFSSKSARLGIGKPKNLKKFRDKMPRLYQCNFR